MSNKPVSVILKIGRDIYPQEGSRNSQHQRLLIPQKCNISLLQFKNFCGRHPLFQPPCSREDPLPVHRSFCIADISLILLKTLILQMIIKDSNSCVLTNYMLYFAALATCLYLPEPVLACNINIDLPA